MQQSKGKSLKTVVRQGLEWQKTLTGGLRLWPDFIIIGVQRGGTTSLFNYLSQHPDVDSSSRKEVHYFDYNFHRGPNWYRSHFPLAIARQKHETLVTGEGSPYYICHPHAARRIKEVIPDVRLIVLLRHPVDRAYSHYQKMVRDKVEDLSFEDAIASEPQRLAGEEQRLREDETYDSVAHRRYSYLTRGHYADQLESWLRIFPREQLLILRSEDLYSEPRQVVEETTSFLGLPQHDLAEYKKYYYGNYEGLNPETRRRLLDYFAPHNEKLKTLLGRDFGWNE